MAEQNNNQTNIKKDEKIKKNLTIFSQETEFEGELEFTDNLVITGRFKGKINASGDLEIDKSAICEVESIAANSITISGRVKGDLKAVERVEMCSGSKVIGNVETGRIRIADDVEFDGNVTMIENTNDVDLFSVSSKEFREGFLLKSDLPH